MNPTSSLSASARRSCALLAAVALAACVAGCGGEQAARPAPSIAPSPSVEAPASASAPTVQAAAPAAATDPATAVVPGQPLPQAIQDKMFQFEARFGRPPTNYSELSRLDQPAGKPGVR